MATTAVLKNNYFAAGPSLPYNIAEAASIEVNDSIYVIGGKGQESAIAGLSEQILTVPVRLSNWVPVR